MLFKKDELRILWPFYLYYLVFGLSMLIMPFFVIYFIDLGFSFFQITIMGSVSALVMFLFEVPTGALADSYSRKLSVLVGFMIVGFSVILIPASDNFIFITILWGLAGFGMTFISGAEEAWVVDNLNYYNRKDLHHEYFIKSQSLTAVGAVVAPLVGALVASFASIKVLWWIFGFGFLVNTALISLFAIERYKPKRKKVLAAIEDSLSKGKEGFKFAFSNKTVLFLLIGGLFLLFMRISEDGWDPLLVNFGLPKASLGLVYSLSAVVMIIIPLSSRALSSLKLKNSLCIVAGGYMLFMFAVLFLSPPAFIALSLLFIMHQGFRATTFPFISTYYHKVIPTDIRATVISVTNMVPSLIGALAMPIAGLLMDKFGPQLIIGLCSLFGIFAIATFLKLKD